MGKLYEPETGQAMFGQPSQQFDGSDLLDAAVERIAREWERVIGNRLSHSVDRPFDNSGATFETDGIAINAYSWGDSTEQPWNLKCGDVEVSWYKHSWRGLSVNRAISNDDIAALLDEALAALRPCDTGHGYEGEARWKPFTYNGTRYSETSYEERRR